MSIIRIQLNYVDSYQTEPTDLDTGNYRDIAFSQVPVIRIFGVSDIGDNVLLHVHGVFPYIYVPYFGADLNQADQIIDELYDGINKAMSIAYRRDVSQNYSYVANIVLCKAVDFYGFHTGWKLFLKIYLLNPSYVNKCADLLVNGKICNRVLQPYEAHIPHISQFFADCNLFGCDWLTINKAYYRGELPEKSRNYLLETIDLTSIKYQKMGVCNLELDITADLILNRHQLVENTVGASLERISDISLNPDDKSVISLKELWKEDVERRQQMGCSPYHDPDHFSQRPHVEVTWERTTEYTETFTKNYIDTDNEVRTGSFEYHGFDTIPTAFQAVDYLFKRKDSEQKDPGNDAEKDDHIIHGSQEDPEDDDLNEPSTPIPFKTPKKMKRHIEETEFSNDIVSPIAAKRTQTLNYFSQEFDDSLKDSQQILKSFSRVDSSQLQHIIIDLDTRSTTVYQLASQAPTRKQVENFDSFGLPEIIYPKPHYTNTNDIPGIPFVHAGVEYKIEGSGTGFLDDFQFFGDVPQLIFDDSGARLLEYAHSAPDGKVVQKWLDSESDTDHKKQYAPVFKFASVRESLEMAKNNSEDHAMTALCVEIHVNTQDGYQPDPAKDDVTAIFWKLLDVNQQVEHSVGIMFSIYSKDNPNPVNYEQTILKCIESIVDHDVVVQVFRTEEDMMDNLINLTQFHDPDVLCGYEINSRSWGYIVERMGGVEFANRLSRVNEKAKGKVKDWWGYTHGAAMKVTGRHMMNIWRILRHEINLSTYTFENVCWQILHERLPHYSQKDLCDYCQSPLLRNVEIMIKYYMRRVSNDLRIMEALELIDRHSEQARILGIDFSSVLTRGSQFKVESLMSRICRKENFLLISPSKEQVANQDALGHIPLVMEPESGLYTDPILVLDFQSLYPSIMIAYNICYSTCLGRVGGGRLGIKPDFQLPPGLFRKTNLEDIFIAPNGMAYVKSHYRKSTLAKMLEEILDTRVMIKQAMRSSDPNNFRFLRKLNNRQLALKLIANVTYGYVSATFSGRMPCTEIADSIVLYGRETLERAIKTINETEKWKARVVYGDTDSIFVLLAGRTKESAFEIGNDIARTITAMNPSPVKLKFENVYLPSIMLTKKRYTGYSYEDVNQKEPFFAAKGTETVRRDGTPAQQRIEKEALERLFKTCDFSDVKAYLEQEWANIMTEKVNIDEFCFSKEVKMGSYRGSTLPPAANIAAKRMQNDPRAEPQYKERVSYVVVAGPAKSRLVDRCVPPQDLLSDPNLHLDSEYYISKHIIPPLERLFNMMGANIRQWYKDMPRFHSERSSFTGTISNSTTSLSLKNYMRSAFCIVCRSRYAEDGYTCKICASNPSHSSYILQSRRKRLTQDVKEIEVICRNCSSLLPADAVKCISEDCPVYYSREIAVKKLNTCVSLEW